MHLTFLGATGESGSKGRPNDFPVVQSAAEHRNYIVEYGEDMPELREWQ